VPCGDATFDTRKASPSQESLLYKDYSGMLRTPSVRSESLRNFPFVQGFNEVLSIQEVEASCLFLVVRRSPSFNFYFAKSQAAGRWQVL
jgi:hypothetical protein